MKDNDYSRWHLPDVPRRGSPVTAATFDRLLQAAREGGWPAVWTTWANGETVKGTDGRERAARRRTLDGFLDRRPDLRALLDDAANEKRDRLLSQLEDEVERIALGPGDLTTDYRPDGSIARTRVDRRNKLYAVLQLLKAHDRERYGDQKRLDVSGNVDHRHAHVSVSAGSGYQIFPNEVLLLPEDRAQLLLELLDELQDAKASKGERDERVRQLPEAQ
ncbi:MAG: hypothetical protein AB7Q00_13895 [Phycisphaerales bacterium]